MSALENSTMLAPCEAAGQSSLAHVWHRLTSSAAYLVRERSKRRHQRRAMAELERLDDRVLKDIGVSRSEIPYVVQYSREASHGWL